jgi:ubiquinone/menaquinone biosynthesis C-methylase UbiE
MIGSMANNNSLIQRQFAKNPNSYATSAVHAQGRSLDLLFEQMAPQAGWRVLDVATGAGHTARWLAAQAGFVVGGDLTRAMLQTARASLSELDTPHTALCQHDAEAIPFAGETFDAVTCRIAAHHFNEPLRFVQEAARVLKPGGLLGLVDNVSSGDPQVGRFVNTFEKLRDPSHMWAYTPDDWKTFLFTNGLTVIFHEEFDHTLDFDDWTARMNVPEVDRTRLRVMLLQAPEGARAWLKPAYEGTRLTFTLREAVIVGRKEAG